MDKQQALRYLHDNPVFWSRLGFCYDPPILDETGAPLIFCKDFTDQLRIHDDFSDAGIKIHTCILHSGWVGVDKYDYSLCDRVLDAIFASGKTHYFIPRIKLNVPVEWCRENPTEVTVYENGPRDRESIRALVGTLKHDYLGYEGGYYNANGWKDPRPNFGGVISMQSFSSEKWRSDAGEALRRLIVRLEKSPYGDRILAYHIAYGTSGESMPWGRISGKFGDYGVTNQRAFREWGQRKYGSYQAMIEAWGSLCEQEIVPPSSLREKAYISSNDFYKDPNMDRWSTDYDTFTAQVNTDALMHFGKIIKDNSFDKPVGSFYGYILHMERCAYAGHLGWKRLLQSDCIDFFAGPKSYFRCEPGEPGGEMAPVVSINRTKLWMDECDNRTHLTVGDNLGNAACPEETYAVMLRELCKNLSHNSGLWYMDLGGGWFDDPGIMNHVSKLLEASERVHKSPHHSIAEITVIADEESILCTHPNVVPYTENLLRDLQLTGAPMDIILSHDVGQLDLSATKLAVLLTPLCLNDYFVAELRNNIAPQAHILFCGKTQAETGVTLLDVPEQPCPTFVAVASERCSVLSVGAHGVNAVETESGDFVLATMDVGVDLLRRIVEKSGVHCYAPSECTVYADNRIVSFFPRRDMAFIPSLPNENRMTELLTGRSYVPGQLLRLKAKEGYALFTAETIGSE